MRTVAGRSTTKSNKLPSFERSSNESVHQTVLFRYRMQCFQGLACFATRFVEHSPIPLKWLSTRFACAGHVVTYTAHHEFEKFAASTTSGI